MGLLTVKTPLKLADCGCLLETGDEGRPLFVECGDHTAVTKIHQVLDGREWSGADDLEAIAEILTRTGRTIRPPEPEPAEEDDGERLECEQCGESFNAQETTCEAEYHCPSCSGTGDGCTMCDLAGGSSRVTAREEEPHA